MMTDSVVLSDARLWFCFAEFRERRINDMHEIVSLVLPQYDAAQSAYACTKNVPIFSVLIRVGSEICRYCSLADYHISRYQYKGRAQKY